MAYLNLMYRQKAEIDPDNETRTADLKQAEDWVNKSLAARKAGASGSSEGGSTAAHNRPKTPLLKPPAGLVSTHKVDSKSGRYFPSRPHPRLDLECVQLAGGYVALNFSSAHADLKVGATKARLQRPVCWREIMLTGETPASKLAGRKAAASCRTPASLRMP